MSDLKESRFFDFSNMFPGNFMAVMSQKVSNFNNSEVEISLKKNIFINTGFIDERVARPDQVHSPITKIINSPGYKGKCDGLISSNRELVLSIKVADCTPCFLFDTVNGNFGLIHSGWRGTVGKIIINGILNMIALGSRLKDILVLLGPSISKKNYEVTGEIAKVFKPVNVFQKDKSHWLVSIRDEIKSDLISFGIIENNIFDTNLCTFETESCHSYRRDGDLAGRMIAYAGYKWN